MSHGGARIGAGRPNIGRQTKLIRVPSELIDDVKMLAKNKHDGFLLYSMAVESGIPVICKNSKYGLYKFNDELISYNPKSYFCIKALGDCMEEFGILENDILLVDCNKKPLDTGNIVVVTNKSNNTVIKKFYKKDGNAKLVSGNKNCPDIDIDNDSPFQILGTVTRIIREC